MPLRLAVGATPDLANKLVPTLVLQQLLGGARMERYQGLLEELALAFAMGTHERLAPVRARRKTQRKCARDV